MRRITKILFSRLIFVAIAIIVQLIWLLALILQLSNYSAYINVLLTGLSFIAVLYVVNKQMNPSYKLRWTILILTLPFFGCILYWIFGKSRVAREIQRQFDVYNRIYLNELRTDPKVTEEIMRLDSQVYNQCRYLEEYAHAPICADTQTRYFPVGEDLYEALLEELRKAEHFIFMEYFIIDNGEMWSVILDVLEEKARGGVDVRLIYDDMGCVTTLPSDFARRMQQKGIQCYAFNPVRPLLSVVINNRDHRKITVIDGYISFTGGINLADEYINVKKRFGHWKDTGIMLKGEAVWNHTVSFLQMWSVVTNETCDFTKYKPHVHGGVMKYGDGFVQPYADSPLDRETVGENAYINMISKAKKYVYIFTPYLIVDNEMMTVLCLAAKNGVDVRIITPGIPDKKLVFLLTRSYYEQLIDAGVKIYEYTPGFLHAKSFVCDDETAIVGTINMDYRSLYLHFECGVFLYKSNAVLQLKKDVLETISKSRPITEEFTKKKSVLVGLYQSILRLFAPLL